MDLQKNALQLLFAYSRLVLQLLDFVYADYVTRQLFLFDAVIIPTQFFPKLPHAEIVFVRLGIRRRVRAETSQKEVSEATRFRLLHVCECPFSFSHAGVSGKSKMNKSVVN